VVKQSGLAPYPLLLKDDTNITDGFIEVKFKAITQQRLETPLLPARMSRKTGGFSRGRRKPHLRGTGWWCW
jgi:hypothetical protein